MPYIRIPSFQGGQQVVDREGRFTPAALRSLNDAFAQLGNAINIIAQIPEIQDALTNLDQATQEARQAAQDARDVADAGSASTALASSYPSGVTLTPNAAGTEVAISSHTRTYATNPPTTVNVTGGTITGLSPATRYFVYYDQASRAGGTVAFMATTNSTEVAQINDRHSVGYLDTPAAGQPAEPGYPVAPPGGYYERFPDQLEP